MIFLYLGLVIVGTHFVLSLVHLVRSGGGPLIGHCGRERERDVIC